MIGGAIAKSRAANEVAAAGGNVTVIQLDSTTSLETSKSKGINGEGPSTHEMEGPARSRARRR